MGFLFKEGVIVDGGKGVDKGSSKRLGWSQCDFFFVIGV